ncbi:MAG: hypothetical protein ACJ754_11075 [Pyrinomonadaceae bacterium]
MTLAADDDASPRTSVTRDPIRAPAKGAPTSLPAAHAAATPNLADP